MYNLTLATLALTLVLTCLSALLAVAYVLWTHPEYFSLADYLRVCREFEALRAKLALTYAPAPSYRSYRTASEVRALRLALPVPTPAPQRFCLPSASSVIPANDVSSVSHEAPTRVARPEQPAAQASAAELPDLPADADTIVDALPPHRPSKAPRERNVKALAASLTRAARTAGYAPRTVAYDRPRRRLRPSRARAS